MKDSLHSMQQRSSEEKLLNIALGLGVFTTLIPVALYGYLGIFSRYGSDDYCISAFYLYTNIIFTGLADKVFGWYNVAILPALMLALFVWGMYLLLKEIVEILQLGWSRWMVFFFFL